MYHGEMTQRDLAWARSHDWGIQVKLKDGIIYDLFDDCVMKDGQLIRKEVSFGSRQALRDWAGY